MMASRIIVFELAALVAMTTACSPTQRQQTVSGPASSSRNEAYSAREVRQILTGQPIAVDMPAVNSWNALQLRMARGDSLDIAADPNQRPIRVWFVMESSQVEHVYIVGHADGACCTRISKAVSDATRQPGLRGSWFSFGVGHLNANGDPAVRAELTRLRDTLMRERSHSACSGQVVLHDLDFDGFATSLAAVERRVRGAYEAASEGQRALFLWHDFDGEVPLLAPIYVSSDESGRIQPLQIRIPRKTFRFPRAITQAVSLDGIGQYIASLRSRIEELDELIELQKTASHFRNNSLKWEFIRKKAEMNYAEPTVRAELHNAIELAEDMIAKWRVTIILAHRFLPASHRAMRDAAQHAAEEIEELKGVIAEARAALMQMRRLSATPGLVTVEILWTEVKPIETDADESFANMLEILRKTNFKSERQDLRKQLVQARRLRTAPPGDPLPALIDASLRGWPATFSSESAEVAFDKWLKQNQVRIWKQVHAQMVAQGVRTSGYRETLSALGASNLLFRVQRDGADYVITPIYVLGDGFYMVADPDTHMVRFESATADHNLTN